MHRAVFPPPLRGRVGWGVRQETRLCIIQYPSYRSCVIVCSIWSAVSMDFEFIS
jgi:hypothetical protein